VGNHKGKSVKVERGSKTEAVITTARVIRAVMDEATSNVKREIVKNIDL
jgi:hypothetical protein